MATANREEIKLNQKLVDSLKPSEKIQFIYDAHKEAPSGFGLKITPRGKKSYFLRYSARGFDTRAVIGSTVDYTLTAARAEANEMRKGYATKGVNVKKEARDNRRQEKERKTMAAVFTLEALCDVYVAGLTSKGKKSASEAESRFKCHVKEPFPQLAAKPANEVTTDDIMLIINLAKTKGKSSGRVADQTRAYLRAAYNAAMTSRHDPNRTAGESDPYAGFVIDADPTAPIKVIPVNTSEQTLTRDQLKEYLDMINGDALQEYALKLALYAGGQRMAQLLRITKNNWDSRLKILTLLDGKGRRKKARVHHLPLGNDAAAVVRKLIKRADNAESEYLFASRGAVMNEGEPGKYLKEQLLADKKYQFNLRDIRRTVETEMARLGISKDIRAQLLSHGIGGVQDKHYDRHDYEKVKREALKKWEEFLNDPLNPKYNKAGD